MAAAIFTSSPAPYLNRLENFDTPTLLRLGLSSGADLNITDAERLLGHTPASAARQCLEMATKGYHTLEYTMSTDSTTAGVINLTTGALVDFLTVGKSRKIEARVYISADVDKSLIEEEYLVACAATPIVYRFLQGFTADAAAAAAARASIGAGDLTTAINVAAAVLSQSANAVILTLTGPTMNARWVIQVKVYPCVSHPLIAS
jgi:hypothetical protein